MNLLVVCGSPRTHSQTRGLTDMVAACLQGREGVKVQVFDVGLDRLPLYTDEPADMGDENVVKWMTLADQADGFVIATPEYHNGMSGALKNALDFLGGSHFRGKPALILATAGGGKGGINALNNLRTVLRGLYALVLAEQFVADPVHFDSSGRFVHPDGIKRVTSMADELVRLTSLVRPKK